METMRNLPPKNLVDLASHRFLSSAPESSPFVTLNVETNGSAILRSLRKRRTLLIQPLVVLLVLTQRNPVSAFTSSPITGSRLRSFHHHHQQQQQHRSQLLQTANIVGEVTPEEEDFFLHGIEPKTKSLPRSMAFYARYVVDRIIENRRENMMRWKGRGLRFWRKPVLLDGERPKKSLRQTLKDFDEQRRNVCKLAGYNAGMIVPSFAFLILGALMTSVIPQFYSECIQCVATKEPLKSKVIRALVGLSITSILAALFTGLRGSLFWIAGSRANYNVRVKLHRSLLLQEAAFFDSNEVGYLLSRLNNDVNKIGNVISFHINVVFRQLMQCIFGSIYMLKISPLMSMYSFLGIGIVAIVSAIYGGFARSLAEDVQNTFADATAVAENAFCMSETIRAFDGASIESTKYEGAQGRALQLEEVQAWAYGTHKFVSDTVQAALQAALLLACWMIGKSGGLPADQMTTFIFYTNFVLESSNEVGDQWAKIQGAIGASTSVFDLIRRIPKVRDPFPKIAAPRHQEEKAPHESILEMRDMSVTYGAMEVPALNNVNLDIYKGDKVAIVGRSGSGKSSMLRTILRFYDPSSGSISLMGQNLKNMTRAELASKVAVVEQEPHLFPMTLIENVLYGIEKDAFDEQSGKTCFSEGLRRRVASCLLMAGLPIQPGNDLNLELDTRIGEGGRSLSGGQRQRVAIARALIRNPKVLLLDEPTAALDSESEKKVVGALLSAMKESDCMVMVTHRLGVIGSLGVNRVIVMEKGKIVESGHPDHLLARPDGLYAMLAREQGITAQPDVCAHVQ